MQVDVLPLPDFAEVGSVLDLLLGLLPVNREDLTSQSAAQEEKP